MTSLTAVLAALALLVPLSGAAAGADGYSETVWAQRDEAAAAGDLENGIRAAKRGDWYLSVHYLERLVERDPQDADALALLGAGHQKLGHLARAARYYEAALVLEPGNRKAHRQLGEIYLAMRQTDKARAQAAILAKLCPQGCPELTALTRAIAAQTARGPGS
jgi:tetratricopeptide (TPR) repeat protein